MILKARLLLLADQAEGGPGWLDVEIIDALDTNLSMVSYQRHDFLTLVGFPNQLNSDSRLAKEICHASCCSATPGF